MKLIDWSRGGKESGHGKGMNVVVTAGSKFQTRPRLRDEHRAGVSRSWIVPWCRHCGRRRSWWSFGAVFETSTIKSASGSGSREFGRAGDRCWAGGDEGAGVGSGHVRKEVVTAGRRRRSFIFLAFRFPLPGLEERIWRKLVYLERAWSSGRAGSWQRVIFFPGLYEAPGVVAEGRLCVCTLLVHTWMSVRFVVGAN